MGTSLRTMETRSAIKLAQTTELVNVEIIQTKWRSSKLAVHSNRSGPIARRQGSGNQQSGIQMLRMPLQQLSTFETSRQAVLPGSMYSFRHGKKPLKTASIISFNL